jgi:adenosylcobyric acid synthase
MLGKELLDPLRVESDVANAEGLGLLDLRTTFEANKQIVRVRARSVCYDEEVRGYEIHMGRTEVAKSLAPMFQILEGNGQTVERFDGAVAEAESLGNLYSRSS